MQGKNIGVVGALGLLPEVLLSLLDERHFPIKTIFLIDSLEHEGKTVQFKGESILIKDINQVDFSKMDLVFFCKSEEISKEFVPIAIKKGAYVIDTTAAFREDPVIPLIVPEINGHLIMKETKLISSPNCTSVFLALSLWGLEKVASLERVVFSSYQAVSGGGRKGFIEMVDQVKDFFKGEEMKMDVFSHPIAFNLIPQIGSIGNDSYYDEEIMMENETKKILGNPQLKVSGTCVRVPVLRAHSISVMAQFKNIFHLDAIKKSIADIKGVKLIDQPEENIFPMPINGSLQNDVLIGRLRIDRSDSQSVLFWVVSDQLLKGTALNYVQIAETLLSRLGG